MADKEACHDDEKILNMHAKLLREHLGLPEQSGGPSLHETMVGLFLERAPPSARGAQCKLPTCDKGLIESGRHRIALSPSMNSGKSKRSRPESADFYHVSCFEEVADLSQSAFLNRIHPITRATFALRGVKATSIMDGHYLVDGGAERLILQWKVERYHQIYERDGIADDYALSDDFKDLLDNAGLPDFKGRRVDRLFDDEHLALTTTLAPTESDGTEDHHPWNLFENYLTTRKPGSLANRHALSEMRKRWEFHTSIAKRADQRLAAWEKVEKATLGPKAIRALQRMSAIPMPDFQGIRLGLRGH